MRARLLSKRASAACLLVALAATGCRVTGDPAPAATVADPLSPAPFRLSIRHIELAPMGNAGVHTGREEDLPRATAERAVDGTRRALERYLSAQFADPMTWFGTEGARALLRPGLFDTLTPEQRHALGHLALPVIGVRTGPATGAATVLFDDREAYAVSIEYEARLTVHFAPEDLGHPVIQRGTVVFTAPAWGVESFELTLDAPQPPPPPPPPASVAAPGVTP